MVLSGVPFWEDGDEALLENVSEGDQDEETPKAAQKDNNPTNFSGQSLKKGKKDFEKNKFEEEGHKPLKNVLALQVAEKMAN